MSNHIDNNGIDAAALDQYLRRNSPLSQHYRTLESDEVPAHLDDRVLAMAREALDQQTVVNDELARVRARRRRLMQWSIPTAVAASALLVISIVIRSGLDHQRLLLPAAQNAPEAASVEATKPEAMPAQEEVVVPIVPSDQLAASPSIPAVADQPAPMRADVDGERRKAAPPPPPALAEMAASEAPSVARQSAPAAPAAPAATGTSAEAAGSVAEPAEAAKREAAQKAANEKSASDEMSEIAVTGYRAHKRAQPAGPHATVDRANGSASLWSTDQLHADPERWLEHIRQLRRDGRNARADREWHEFHEQYPDYSVAEDDLARGAAEPTH